MKEGPILFSTEMVRAILDGRKTQTRRVINRIKKHGIITQFREAVTAGYRWMFRNKFKLWNEIRHEQLMERCPYGQPGDGPLRTFRERLPEKTGYYYVKWTDEGPEILVYLRDCRGISGIEEDSEDPPFTWGFSSTDDPEYIGMDITDPWAIKWRTPGDRLYVRETLIQDQSMPPGERLLYLHRNEPIDDLRSEVWVYRYVNYKGKVPAIFMPKWAARIWLEITDIRVERVQDITSSDAVAEGILEWRGNDNSITQNLCGTVPRTQFMLLWNSINEKRGFGWDVNPYVWVVEFKVISTGGKNAR